MMASVNAELKCHDEAYYFKVVVWNKWTEISLEGRLAANFSYVLNLHNSIWLDFGVYLWLPDSEDITGSLLQKALFPTKCNKELASVTFQSPDFEYTPSDIPEVNWMNG